MLIGIILAPCIRSLMSSLASEKEQGEWKLNPISEQVTPVEHMHTHVVPFP